MNQQITRERNKLLHSFERLLEGPMIFLGFVWLVLLIVDMVYGLNKLLQYLSTTIWIIFMVDFLLKLILAPAKVTYLLKNWLTAISLVIPALRIFRVLRLLRLVKSVRLVKVIASLNRSMKSLGATMHRRGVVYVVILALIVTFGGAAGMYAIERPGQGFENYGMALWWTGMRVILAGSDHWPRTSEGRGLAFILSLFGYAVFGYVTATLATFFIRRDAEEDQAPIVRAKDIETLQKEIKQLTQAIRDLGTKTGAFGK